MIYVDLELEELSEEKQKKFIEFEELLALKFQDKELLYLYRGTKYSKIKDMLAKNDERESEIFRKVFLFGEKSAFSLSKVINREKENLFSDDINDCSEKTLKKIFESLSLILEKSKFSKNVRKYLPNSFQTYFSYELNKEEFVNVLISLSPRDRLLLRDYYLYLMHTAESIKADDMLLSTSIKRATAKQFTRKENNNKRLVFKYFIPQPYECHTITPWIMEDIVNKVSEIKLPIYNPKGLYPSQSEVALKGGAFPHYILGIELVDEGKFIVNPHFFNSNESQYDYMIKNGIIIDQSSFDGELPDTNFSNTIHQSNCGGIISRINENS